MELKELQKLIVEFSEKRDWKKFHNPKDLASAIAIESGELQEHFLWKPQEESYKIGNKNEVAEELSDIVNFCFLMAENCGIDLEKSIIEKMEKNDKKYPIEKFKGKNDKYNSI